MAISLTDREHSDLDRPPPRMGEESRQRLLVDLSPDRLRATDEPGGGRLEVTSVDPVTNAQIEYRERPSDQWLVKNIEEQRRRALWGPPVFKEVGWRRYRDGQYRSGVVARHPGTGAILAFAVLDTVVRYADGKVGLNLAYARSDAAGGGHGLATLVATAVLSWPPVPPRSPTFVSVQTRQDNHRARKLALSLGLRANPTADFVSSADGVRYCAYTECPGILKQLAQRTLSARFCGSEQF